MTLQARIKAFEQLGVFLKDEKNKEEIELWAYKARNQNNWFTLENTKKSLETIANYYLEATLLEQWSSLYEIPDKPEIVKSIGVIMAGNIPAVGFHDFLCVLMAGHELHAKLF